MIAGGRLDDAIATFERAAQVAPKNPDVRRLLSLALFDRGDHAAAAIQAREGLAISPGDVGMRELLTRAESARPQQAR